MPTDVTVLDDGTLAITCDGITHPPLPIEAIETAYARLDDARHAATRQTLTFAVRALTDVLLTQGADMSASVEVGPDALTATVDAGSYQAVRTRLRLTPNPDGHLVWGPVTVTTPPAPDPAPDPASGEQHGD